MHFFLLPTVGCAVAWYTRVRQSELKIDAVKCAAQNKNLSYSFLSRIFVLQKRSVIIIERYEYFTVRFGRT
jgi:hypothetical protein